MRRGYRGKIKKFENFKLLLYGGLVQAGHEGNDFFRPNAQVHPINRRAFNRGAAFINHF